jgi:hypothetical protein
MDESLGVQMDGLNLKGKSVSIINDAKVLYRRSSVLADAYFLDAE